MYVNGDLNRRSQNANKGFRRKWTRTEVILAFILIVTVIYILYNTLILQVQNTEQNVECGDPNCYESIVEINNFVDPSVDPCEDFHQFACGNFFETAYKKQITAAINEEQQQLENELNAMIVDPVSPKDSRAIKLLKLFYSACVNVDAIDAEKDEKLMNLIDEIGGWPLLQGQTWQNKDFDWIDAMIKCRQLGLPFQWFFEFGIHWENRNYFKISYPSYVKSSKTADKISNHMKDVIGSLTGSTSHIQRVSDFGQRFGQIVVSQNSEITLTTVREMQQNLPLINWPEFLNGITDGSYEFTEETQIASNIGKYTVELIQLLKGTDKRIQANYIIWRIIQYFSPYMSSRVRQHVEKTQEVSRTEFCKEKANERYSYVIETEYTKKYFTKELKHSGDDIINAIKSEFLERITKISWTNDIEGQNYVDRLTETEVEIGVQEDILDDAFTDANYIHIGDLDFDDKNSSITEMITKGSKFYYDSLFSNINETGIDPVEKDVLKDTIKMSSTYYRYLNKLLLPLPLMHGFLYNHKRPNYLNFGSLGTILAEGLVSIVTNNDNITGIPFVTTNICFEDEYVRLASGDENLNKSYVANEVLPDVIARDIAYAAYQKWVASNGEEIQLPLLPYTPNQLFWIKSSLINCHKKLPNVEEGTETELSKYKNILSARHSRYFAEDFGCKEKTPMNPEHKC